MDLQTLAAYAVVLWAVIMVVWSIHKALRGQKTLPQCPGCDDECDVKKPLENG